MKKDKNITIFSKIKEVFALKSIQDSSHNPYLFLDNSDTPRKNLKKWIKKHSSFDEDKQQKHSTKRHENNFLHTIIDILLYTIIYLKIMRN
jgi:hypothetical protein